MSNNILLSPAVFEALLEEGDAATCLAREEEGTSSLRFCQGPLHRKRHRAQAKVKKWKQKWFKVEPGKETLRNFACISSTTLVLLCSSPRERRLPVY